MRQLLHHTSPPFHYTHMATTLPSSVMDVQNSLDSLDSSLPSPSTSISAPPSTSSSTSPPTFASSLSLAVSSSLPFDEPALALLVLSYVESFELEMSAFLLSQVLPSLPSVAVSAVVPAERRWSASVRWHWLTFSRYFAGSAEHYMDSHACAYTRSQDGRWVEKAEAVSDVHVVLRAMEEWAQRRAATGVMGSASMRVQTWEWVNRWAASQRRCVTFPCWVSLRGVHLQYFGPLNFLFNQKGGVKREMSAYIHFSNAHRAQVKEEFPETKFGEVARELTDRWKNATEEEKAPFHVRAAEDRRRYEAEKMQVSQMKQRVEWVTSSDDNDEEEEEDSG